MKKHLKTYKKYYAAYGIFLICLFGSAEIYSHWHFDVISPVELYLMDKEKYERSGTEIPFMNFNEWQIDQDKRQTALIDEIAHQICESFDPWYERTPADEVRDHGQD